MKKQKNSSIHVRKKIGRNMLLFLMTFSLTLSAQTITRKATVVGNSVNVGFNASIDAIALNQTLLATTASTLNGAEVTIWNVRNNKITEKTSILRPFVIDNIRSAKLSNTRFVNAYVSGTVLKLEVYDISNNGNTITIKDSKDSDSLSSGVARIISLSPTRFVTTFIATADRRLRSIVWDIDNNGIISRKGSINIFQDMIHTATTALSSDKFVASYFSVELPSAGLVTIFSVNSNGDISLSGGELVSGHTESIRLATLTSNRFVYSSNNENGGDNLFTWNVATDDTPSPLASTQSVVTNDGAIASLNYANIATAVLENSSNTIKINHFKIATDGSFTLKGQESINTGKHLAVTNLFTTSTSSRIVTAFVTANNKLKLISWDIDLSSGAREYAAGTEELNAPLSDVGAYPNPASNNASFTFHLNEDSNASLKIYNALGELIEEVATGKFTKGDHQVNWSVESVPAGIYYYSFESAGQHLMKKLVVTH